MIALMGATNPFWEYLLIPLVLFGAGIATGWYIRSIDAEPEPDPGRVDPTEPQIRILGPDREPYDWEKEDTDGT